jgi:hypothetical protein
MYDDPTPHQVMRETGRWFPAALVALGALLALAAVATVILWQLHAWVFTQETKLQNNVYQGSYGVQQADIDAMQRAIGAIGSAAGKAQANADAQEACSYAAKITIMPPGDKGWVAQNCLAGAVAPGSRYAR